MKVSRSPNYIHSATTSGVDDTMQHANNFRVAYRDDNKLSFEERAIIYISLESKQEESSRSVLKT